jgi:hypothetical protein
MRIEIGYLCYNPEKGRRPWYSKLNNLILLDIFLIGWIQRICMIKNAYNVSL